MDLVGGGGVNTVFLKSLSRKGVPSVGGPGA